MSEDRIRDLEDRVQQLEKRLSSAQHSRYYGYEYKSAITVWGWPLLHIAQGIDPESGRPRVAKGIIAIGNTALGGVAIGGIAVGVITLGGMALGLVSLGGLSIGLAVALGGVALGGLAIGGLAGGLVACGGLAVGYYACGGQTIAAHSLAELVSNPDLPVWARQLLQSLQEVGRHSNS